MAAALPSALLGSTSTPANIAGIICIAAVAVITLIVVIASRLDKRAEAPEPEVVNADSARAGRMHDAARREAERYR